MTLIYVVLIAAFSVTSGNCMTRNERVEMREIVKDMFDHAYNSYMTYAYPADELMPLNCKGRYRGTELSRGDVDDILGNFSMTLIDSLDSLVIFGEISKFEDAVKLVIDEVDFDNDIVVSTFETNIRVLGGLLGGHVAADVLKNSGSAMEWYNDELLTMAKDIGERLMPAFNTTTGIPYPKVNLRYGVADRRSRTGTESATCTACAGTMIMEFGALSRLTGDPKFETVAHKAMKALWTYRSRSSDLVGTVINIHNGEWVRRDSGVGAGIDSYYEYCLKAYILLGEEDYLQRFNQHYKAVMRYINRDSFFVNVHMNNPSKRSVTYMDSLQAFWPGLQVLKGDIKSAIELHEVFYSVAKRHTFLPEAFTTNFDVHWGQHFLRPELVESTYFLYEATKDPYYLDVGKYIVENLNKYTRVPCGFAAVKDVRTLSHENRMDSFLLSETLKYMYLLFTDKEDLPINLQDFVFTTEAHILPLALSNWNGSSSQNNVYESENLHDHSCPRTAKDDSMSFAEKIRKRSRQSNADQSCPKTREKQNFVKSKSTAPLLRAEQFIPGNKDHLLILKAMGISVTKTNDGKVQLMQDANSADNNEMANEGVTFMQSMIELAKFRSNDAEYLPRVVQILSTPYDGNIVLNAGPAQFGIDLGKSGMGVSAEVVLADPFKGCTQLKNKEAADHRIVIMERGDCMFIDKVRIAESLGAVGAIIIDNNEGSSSESQPMFAMSGDGSQDNIKIPAVFLFHNEGQVLQKSMQIVGYHSNRENLRVRLADKALKKDANTKGALPSTDATQTGEREKTTAEQIPAQQQKEKLHEPISRESQRFDNVGNEMDKLINLMQNVVKQPGFEFLTGRAQPKASVMMGEINSADKRERWLYDVMMQNWREQRLGENGESKSGNVDEVVGKFQDGVFSIKKQKVSSSQGECWSIKEGGEARKTSEEFLNAVVQRSDARDSEVFVVGIVDDGKLSGENAVQQQIVDEEQSSHEHGGEQSNSDRSGHEVDKDTVSEEKMVSSDGFVDDVLNRDLKHGDTSVNQEEIKQDEAVTAGSFDSSMNENDEVGKDVYIKDSMDSDLTSNQAKTSQEYGEINQNAVEKSVDTIVSSGSLMNEKDEIGKDVSIEDSLDGDFTSDQEKTSQEQEARIDQNTISDNPMNDAVDEIVYFSDIMTGDPRVDGEDILKDSNDDVGKFVHKYSGSERDTHTTGDTRDPDDTRDPGDTTVDLNSFEGTIENDGHVVKSVEGEGSENADDSAQQGVERTFETSNNAKEDANQHTDATGTHTRQDLHVGTQESNSGDDSVLNHRESVSMNADKKSEDRNIHEVYSEQTTSNERLTQTLDDRTSIEEQNKASIHDNLFQADLNDENYLYNSNTEESQVPDGSPVTEDKSTRDEF